MADITQLILDDHDSFRRQFAQLDELREDAAQAGPIWAALAAALEVHASAEEVTFYPVLLKRGEDPVEEVDDAIGDHDDIRDGTHRASRAKVGSATWWKAVDDTRAANTDHMGEEEDGALADARRTMSLELREKIGVEFQTFKQKHPAAKGLSGEKKGAEAYLDKHT